MERERLPDTRQGITHKGNVGGTEFYITVGIYEDGRPAELFITIAKEGSTMAGIMDAFGTAISLLLQSHWSIETLAKKFRGSKFVPDGMTCNEDIPKASSIVDYIFQWMLLQFSKSTEALNALVFTETKEESRSAGLRIRGTTKEG